MAQRGPGCSRKSMPRYQGPLLTGSTFTSVVDSVQAAGKIQGFIDSLFALVER